MSVSLTQSASAAFPDRGSTGLLVSMIGGGGDGAYLSHDLGASRDRLHVRLMLNAGTAVGGRVRVAGGHDPSGQERWWLDFDADARRIALELDSGQRVEAALNALAWQCVEVKVDAGAGAAQLWVNGLSAGVVSGALGTPATRHVWIGGVFKDTAAAGEFYLDEWVIADGDIGPVVVPARSAYADDAARWLVIYNAADAEAAIWAEAYRAARGVPYANLLGVALPVAEVIDAAQYAQLATAVNAYLASTGLDAQVMGVLAGYRVPGYVDSFGDGQLDAVPALLHRDATFVGPSGNPDAADALPVRPTKASLGPNRLAARIDGPDLAWALALVDRATTLMSSGLGDGEGATIWFDPFVGDGGLYQVGVNQMVDWALSIDRMRTRLPIEFSGDPSDRGQVADFSVIQNDGFFWGWKVQAGSGPPAGFWGLPVGKRVLSVQLDVAQATATTLRDAAAGNWIVSPIAAGYAAAVAASRVYSASALPYARPLFEALRRGWTLGEAWYLSLPMLREGLYLVGDPLLRVAFPQAGWDVFGPLDRLESLDPVSPMASLRASERSLILAGAQRPEAGQRGWYVVRRVDERGRSEASCTVADAVNAGEEAAAAPRMPAWPDAPDWPVWIEAGQLVLRAVWERPMGQAMVASVELRGEEDGEAEATLAEVVVDPRSGVVEVRRALPTERGRYRWRVTSVDGVAMTTPWSAWVRPAGDAVAELTVMEVRP